MNKFLSIVLLAALFASCRTVKQVERVKTVIDSSYIEQNETLQRALNETIENYEKQIEYINKSGVVFDTVYKDTGTSRVINRVEYYESGKLKSAEGRIKSINTDLLEKSTELKDAYRLVDSMGAEIEKKDAQLSKQVTTITKDVKRKVTPWWLFALFLVAGLILESRFKLVTRLNRFVISKWFTAAVFVLGALSCQAQEPEPAGRELWFNGVELIPWVTGGACVFFLLRFVWDYIAYRSYKGERKQKYFNSLIYAIAFFTITLILIMAILNG